MEKITMYLCETEYVFLKAGVLYEFEVHPTCDRCKAINDASKTY